MGKERIHFSNRVPLDAITHTHAGPLRRQRHVDVFVPRVQHAHEDIDIVNATLAVGTPAVNSLYAHRAKKARPEMATGTLQHKLDEITAQYACVAGPFNSNKRNTFNDWVVSHTRIHKHYTLQSLTARTPQRKSHDSNQPTSETVLNMRRFLGPSMILHKDSFMSGLNA